MYKMALTYVQQKKLLKKTYTIGNCKFDLEGLMVDGNDGKQQHVKWCAGAG
jgi:hypothetical protein